MVSACMARAGLGWSPPPTDPATGLSPHGIFGLETPLAVRNYRLARGYGVVEIVQSMLQSSEAFDTFGQHDAGAGRAADYRQALLGGEGCMRAAISRTGGVEPDGGALGHAYGDAISTMESSDQWGAIEDKIVECMRTHGYEIPALAAASNDLLRQFLDMTGGTYTTTTDGLVGTYEVPAQFHVNADDLAALHNDEFERAKVEAGCRDDDSSRVDALLAAHSVPVIAAFRREINRLRHALLDSRRGELH
jgi:hypothetical protein